MSSRELREIAGEILDGHLQEERNTSQGSDLERATKLEELEGKRQDRKQRGKIGNRLFSFMYAYMGAVLLIVIATGVGWFRLSDAVLITLLTTTLADVIGVFSFVAKYLFHTD